MRASLEARHQELAARAAAQTAAQEQAHRLELMLRDTHVRQPVVSSLSIAAGNQQICRKQACAWHGPNLNTFLHRICCSSCAGWHDLVCPAILSVVVRMCMAAMR